MEGKAIFIRIQLALIVVCQGIDSKGKIESQIPVEYRIISDNLPEVDKEQSRYEGETLHSHIHLVTAMVIRPSIPLS